MAKKKKVTSKKPAPKKSKNASAKKASAKKASAKKASAKKASAKKASAKKASAKKSTAARTKPPAKKKAPVKQKKPRVRRDATGHLDPSYARDLRRRSRENEEHDDDRGFLIGKRRDDALAQELGREFVETVTSGEDEGIELRDEVVPEETGGPFVNTTLGQEVAEDTDESNPVDATREPFPKT